MRHLGLLTAALLLVTTALAAGLRQGDLIEMTVLDSFFVHGFSRYVCGDADRDGMPEIYVRGLDSLGNWEAQVIEYAGGNTFEVAPLGFTHANHWAVGDGDGDGLADLITQEHGGICLLFESLDSFSLPRDSVWRLVIPYMGTGFQGIITDIDRDGHEEISVVITQPYAIDVYENRGDNTYELAWQSGTPPGVPLGPAVADDMDRDGKPELLLGTDGGHAVVYEAALDDSLVLIADLPTPYWIVAGVGAAPDLDRDGRPEGIFLSWDWQAGAYWLEVYEAVADDSFEVVWSLDWDWTDGPFADGLASIATGDIDGDLRDELMVAHGNVRIFRCTGNDSYELIWQELTGAGAATLYDVNCDGRAELIHRRGWHWTLIREYLGPGIAEQEPVEVEKRPGPTVMRASDLVRYEGRILDALGREVRSSTSHFGVCTSPLPPGVYFLKSEVRSPNAELLTRKVLVVR